MSPRRAWGLVGSCTKNLLKQTTKQQQQQQQQTKQHTRKGISIFCPPAVTISDNEQNASPMKSCFSKPALMLSMS
jgi:hypothetical protein